MVLVKLKQKLYISIIVIVISVVAILLLVVSEKNHQHKADVALTEAKEMLAGNLGVQPGDLTVYWSGEYPSDSQYRYRYHRNSTSLADDGEYIAHSRSVEPEYDDHVIQDEEVKKLVLKTIRHYNNAERAVGLQFFAFLAIIAAIAAIPVNIILSLYRWLMAEAE